MVDGPRNPEWLKADLTRLHHQRADHQSALVATLNSIDAIDGKIESRLAELARAMHPSSFRRAS